MNLYDEQIDRKKSMVTKLLRQRKEELKNKIDSLLNQNSKKQEDQIVKKSEIGFESDLKNLQELMGVTNTLKQESNSLKLDCEYFNVNDFDINAFADTILQIEKEINSSFDCISLYIRFQTEMESIKSSLWINFRNELNNVIDFSLKWTHVLENKDFDNKVFHLMKRQIDAITSIMPVLQYCHGESFMDDHWMELIQGQMKLPKDVKVLNLTFGHFTASVDVLLQKDVENNLKDLQSRARGEVTIRSDLHEISSWIQKANLSFSDYELFHVKTALIKNCNEILTDIEKKQLLLSSIKKSYFFKPFSDVGKVYEKQLSDLFIIIDLINKLQIKWQYLHPIFSSNNVPDKWFKKSDIDFRQLLSNVKASPILLNVSDESQIPKLEKVSQSFSQAQRYVIIVFNIM